MMDESVDIKQLESIIRRRKMVFAASFGLIFLSSALVAVMLPPIFRSEARIVIEAQQIPEEYVKSAITGYVNERIEMITQQVLSAGKLAQIIQDHDLYPEIRERHTLEDASIKMRKDIELETINIDMIDKRTGRQSSVTTAFSLFYEGKDPKTVQKVTYLLAMLYVEAEMKSREKVVTSTTAFLQEELSNLKSQIDAHEIDISRFKEKHMGELPEQKSMNISAMEWQQRKIDQLNMQIRSLEERKIYLSGQIANMDPIITDGANEGEIALNPIGKLKSLRLRLYSLKSTLSDKHPDIKKLKREIAKLAAYVGDSEETTELAKGDEASDSYLLPLAIRQESTHTGSVQSNNEGSSQVKSWQASHVLNGLEAANSNNPAYINLMTQLASADIELKSLHDEKKNVLDKIEDIQRKIEIAPLVEREYNLLTLDYQSAKSKYNEIMDKLIEARVAQGMEKTQRGERFTIAEPPLLPEKPYKPNRFAIVIIGFVLALGAGVGIAALQEYMDHSVKTVEEVANLIESPVFSVIPYMLTDEEQKARRLRRMALICAAIVVVVIALAWIHVNEIPLDSLITKIQRKVMLKLAM